jgi:hypothetical protein
MTEDDALALLLEFLGYNHVNQILESQAGPDQPELIGRDAVRLNPDTTAAARF